MECSVVIPLFNEKESLPQLQERLHSVLEEFSCNFEIIYVNDGSTDSSLETLNVLKADYPSIRIISLEKNQGQSVALFAGFRESRGEWIITMDADLQNPPEEIHKLWQFKDGYDFITGIREKRRDSLFKKGSSRIAKFFRQAVLGDTTLDTGCSLRLFRRKVLERLPFFRNFHRFFTFLTRESGFKIKEVPLRHSERKFGKSKYTTWKRAKEGVFDLLGVFWLKRRIIH
jgi:glycosyltransferase involved in cell wall biosynthesis